MPSYSVPTSPAIARSASQKGQPITPQRLPASRQHHRHSSSQSFYRSPITPASPYTPLSLRSFASSGSGGSSTLTTPDNIGLGLKRLSFSPEVARTATVAAATKDQSLADIAENWRSRASENGIKVSSVNDDSHYGDDEASERALSDAGNDSAIISTEEALLPPPFFSNQRRTILPKVTTRPRAQSHVPQPTSRVLSSPTIARNPVSRAPPPPTSPLVARRLNQSQNLNQISTPPQNRTLARQLKLKGSFTDPAHTRRREAFGIIRTPSQNINKSLNAGLTQDTSLDLFDIDENDFEYEYEYPHGLDHMNENEDNSLFTLNFHNNDMNSDAGTAYGYPSYSLPILPQQQLFASHIQSQPFSDPFQGHALSSIAESVEHHFHTHQQVFANNNSSTGNGYVTQAEYQPYQHLDAPPGLPVRIRGGPEHTGGPAWTPIPGPIPVHTHAAMTKPTVKVGALDTSRTMRESQGCSVCLTSHPRTLAVLIPCGHPLCSGCLTSALNIVGEKDMECAVCREKVGDFKLIGAGATASEGKNSDGWESKGSFMDSLFSSPGSKISDSEEQGIDGLDSAFEFGLGLESARASTPKLREDRKDEEIDEKQKVKHNDDNKMRQQGRGNDKGGENVVLRIDNVPWDITPPQIKRWLQQPVERVHVLLDAKGKTMSHAYVEVKDAAVAGRVLRGEGGGLEGSRKQDGNRARERGSILGKGRRARGVTITKSGQEELMADLFPNWKGIFDGSRPSLAGLDGEKVIGALEGGLLGESEIAVLLHLIREPDSHFLKVPSLPFHSLISILSKFPADVDSRVFWTANVRDTLYDVTYAAVQILLSCVDRNQPASQTTVGNNEYSMEIVSELVKTAIGCRAFTAQQLSKFVELLESCSLDLSTLEDPLSESGSSSHSITSEPRTPETQDLHGRVSAVSATMTESEAPILASGLSNERSSEQALADIAREFGVEAQLVQALAKRLAGLC